MFPHFGFLDVRRTGFRVYAKVGRAHDRIVRRDTAGFPQCLERPQTKKITFVSELDCRKKRVKRVGRNDGVQKAYLSDIAQY